MCVCVCVCALDSETERVGKRKRRFWVGGSRTGAVTAGQSCFNREGGVRTKNRSELCLMGKAPIARCYEQFDARQLRLGSFVSSGKRHKEEEAIPELEIDVDELLDMQNDCDRASRVKDLLVDCYKPTDDFVTELLDKIRGMQKLSTPQKK
ncbi:protein phosphatase 1, regulatory (inhibitor) subunit 14Bb isoform X1 [Denticeps clupeoides]|uniref:Protein phosphatase 1 regulatory subunit 14B n=1 Tax=Denticeps clupeoides TaxID=299321 RepID=A0AAY4BUW5_9TELE|nr:protein phosphatase 1 regulatory subunit 14B isoform X1 [Denticeps clupeoides]